MPLISVIIPAYNSEEFIVQSICSILCQTNQDFEILIYDDKSTDKTVTKIKEFSDKRIRFFQGKKNVGPSGVRNYLFEKARGDFITLQDSDDISHPERLEILSKFLNNSEYIWVGTWIKIINSTIIYKYDNDPKKILLAQSQVKKVIPGAACMFKRAILEKGIRYDERITKGGEDVLFESMIQYHFPLCMTTISDILYYYRKHKDSLTFLRKHGEFPEQNDIMTERDNLIRLSLLPLVKKFVH
jgi:glycosyltransferase involved in cell wall biosynthesis